MSHLACSNCKIYLYWDAICKLTCKKKLEKQVIYSEISLNLQKFKQINHIQFPLKIKAGMETN